MRISSREMASPLDFVCGGSSVGMDLKLARERLGKELSEVSSRLRIRVAHLQALEQGRIGDLPGKVYALGYLRSYAKELGLNPEELARRFKEETRQGGSTDLDFPAPVPERSIPAGAVVLLGFVLAVGAYAGWYRLSGQGKLPAEVVPPVPTRLVPLAEQAIPAPSPPRPMTHSPAPANAPAPAPEAAPETAAILAAPPSSASTAEPALAPLAVPPSSAAAATSADQTRPVQGDSGAQGRPAAPEESRIVLRAKDDAWMQVRDRSGQVLLNRVLRAGETWPVPAKPSLLLSTGNAGGTELLVDGVVAPPIGNPGAVRRDLPLDPDTIKDGKLPAQVQAAGQSTAGHAGQMQSAPQ
jgi:cytoskeleton protein RodZ